MDSKNENEMEQIQRGLEAFLEKELDVIGASGGNGRRNGGSPNKGAEGRHGHGSYEAGLYEEDAYEDGIYEDSYKDSSYEKEDGMYEDELYEEERPIGRRADGRRHRQDEERIQIIGQSERTEPSRGRSQYQDEEARGGRGRYQDEEAHGGRGRYQDEEARGGRGRYQDEEPHGGRGRYRDEEPRGGRGRYRDEEPRGGRSRYQDEEPRRRNGRYQDEEPYDGRRYDEDEPPRRRGRYQDEEPYRKGSRRDWDEPPEEKQPKRKKRSRREEEALWEEDSEMSRKSKKAQKKRRKRKHRLLKFLIGVAVIFCLLGFGLYQLVGAVYGKMSYSGIDSVAKEPMKEDGVVNILLIGNDSRENGEDGRSDAMILLSISSKTKTIYMTSLLRDMYVDIPGHEGNRLNAAYSFGGAELLMDTIEQNFDISVNRYVLVNFEAFANLVDAVDGIELELTSEEIEYINGYLVEYNMLTGREQGTDNMDTSVSGLVHLNGPQALAYSRNRYLGTDFGRTERQRKVLTAVIKKMPSAMLTNAGGLMDSLLPNLTTNLTRSECFQLSLMAGKLVTYDIVSDSIPQPGTYRDVTIRKMMVLEVDFETNIKYLKEKIYGE